MSVSDNDLREEVLQRFSSERLLREIYRRGDDEVVLEMRFSTEQLVDELDRREQWDTILSSRIHRISAINLARCLRWHPDGINSWSFSDWAVALAGEVGELCDVVKKLNRVRDGLRGNKLKPEELVVELSKEVADVYIYLDLFAQAAKINLYESVKAKFNEVSDRNGFPERL